MSRRWKKVLITGVAGMIGSALARKLLKQNIEVWGIDDFSRGRPEFIPEGVKFIQQDLKYLPDSSAPLFLPSDLDVIFHLAAVIGGVGRMHSAQYESGVNLLIDRNVFNYALQEKCHIYYQSTACCYPVSTQSRGFSEVLLSENDVMPADPESVYGWAKLIGEKQLTAANREFNLPVSIGRAFNVIGPNEADKLAYSHVVPALIQKILTTEKDGFISVWGSGNQERSFLYVDDAAEGIIAIAKRNQEALPMNIGTTTRQRINDIAKMLIDISGKDLTIENDLSKPEGVFTRGPALTRIMQETGWRPTTGIRESLQKTWDWWNINWDWLQEKIK